MNKLINFFNSHQYICKMVLMILAVVSGGATLAMADNVEPQIGDEGVNPANGDTVEAKEPVQEGKSDMLSPGGKHDGQDLTPSQASSTQLNEGGLIEDEWDTEVVKFYAYKTPLLSIARQVATKVNITNWTKKHFRVGGETLDGVVTTDIAAGDTIELTPSNFSGSLRPFYKCSTVYVPDVDGYATNSKTVKEGCLQLYVISSDVNGKRVVLQATNGPVKNDGDLSEDLDNMTCPKIPKGSVILAGATACSESQLIVPPENYQPREKEVCVQKKLLNILYTTDFEKVQKKVPIGVTDLKANAIKKYNLRCERSYWLGSKAKFKSITDDGAIEDVYISEGLLKQLTNSYAIGDEYSLADLTALSKLMFTDFAENDHAFVFCGKNAIERLENIKLGEGRQNVFTNHNEYNLTLKKFTNTFGSFEFIWDQTLDLMHMEDYMVIMDLKASRRYVRVANKERTNDMSKGGGAIRDAKRWIHEEADCIALRGYNSILVGPQSKIARLRTATSNAIISMATLPEVPAKGMKIALTADYSTGGVTYDSGTVYTYNGTGWELYKGQDFAA